MMLDEIVLRPAVAGDIPALTDLMHQAIRELLKPFLTPEQVEASFAVMGLDSQLIEDSTYFVAEIGGDIAGCGGWSRRATLFGGDHSAGRDAAFLDPARDSARVRAMYTHPKFARQGVGRKILHACERAAIAAGFSSVELAATAGGEPLYRACGYRKISPIRSSTPNGVQVPLALMRKVL